MQKYDGTEIGLKIILFWLFMYFLFFSNEPDLQSAIVQFLLSLAKNFSGV